MDGPKVCLGRTEPEGYGTHVCEVPAERQVQYCRDE